MKAFIALTLFSVLACAHCKPLVIAEEQDLAKINGIKSSFFNFLKTAGCALQKIGGGIPSEEVDIEAFNLRRALQGFIDCLPQSTQPPPYNYLPYRPVPRKSDQNEELLNEIMQELEDQVAQVEGGEEEMAKEQVLGALLGSVLTNIISSKLG